MKNITTEIIRQINKKRKRRELKSNFNLSPLIIVLLAGCAFFLLPPAGGLYARGEQDTGNDKTQEEAWVQEQIEKGQGDRLPGADEEAEQTEQEDDGKETKETTEQTALDLPLAQEPNSEDEEQFTINIPNVVLNTFDYQDEKIEQKINTMMSFGFLPVGLEVSPGHTFSILFILHRELSARRWLIHKFDDLDNLDEEFTELMLDDWFPMDISFTGDSMYGLFIPTPYEWSGWRILPSTFDSDDITETLNRFRGQGFIPWGITGLDEQLFFLLIRITDRQMEDFFVNLFSLEDQELEMKLKTDIQQGWVPWGLLQRDPLIGVLYTK